MKTLSKATKRLCLSLIPFACLSFASLQAADTANHPPAKVAVVNFKYCVEHSKIGQQEQSTFDMIKKQMETSLEEREKAFKEKRKPYDELKAKLEDEDYVDGLTPEAEKEMHAKLEGLTRDLTQMQLQVQELQQQYLQALQQANLKIIQKLAETVSTASEKVAKDMQFDFVLNEDSCFYYKSDFEISKQVVAEMDSLYEKELKDLMQKQPAGQLPTKGNW